jgi:hypothetical protein
MMCVLVNVRDLPTLASLGWIPDHGYGQDQGSWNDVNRDFSYLLFYSLRLILFFFLLLPR